MKKKYALALALLLPVSLLLVAACDKASPVAPAGTVLTLSVSPSQITANGTATVLVTALKSNGTPVNPGTQIRFGTTLGTIDPVAEIGDDGVATATLRGTGEIGTATVTARAGTTEAVTAEVQIGKSAGSVSLQANPSQIPETGGTVQLVAVVRDETGQPLADAPVNFQTEAGTLGSGGSIRTTNRNGQVTDTLRLDESDITALQGGNFTVQAFAAGNVSDSTTIRIATCRPVVVITASFVSKAANGKYLVDVTNNSTGAEPLDWTWYKDGVEVPAYQNLRNPPNFEFDTTGSHTIRLDASNECGQDSGTAPVNIPPDGPAT